MKIRTKQAVFGLLCLLFCLNAALAGEAEAKSKARLGFGTSLGVGAAIPKGELWSVKTRASVGFSLSAGLRVLFGKSCTEPTLFFIPYVIDTKKDGGRNGSYLSALLGMQIYPYNVLFVQPYFMFGFGFGWVSYEGPSTTYPSGPLQKGSGLGVLWIQAIFLILITIILLGISAKTFKLRIG